MKKLSIGILTAALMWLGVPGAAEAVQGVKYIHFDPSQSLCHPVQGPPCDPDAGVGVSNKLYVHQSEIDGQWVFDFLSVPGMPSGYMWVAPSYGAKCKTGYSVEDAYVRFGYSEGEGNGGDAIEVHPVSWSWDIDFGSNQKKIDDHTVDIQVPIDHAFGELEGANSSVFGFGSIEDVLDYGENRIATRVAEGMTEEDARTESFSFNTHIAMHGIVRCKGNTFGREGWMARAEWLPLEIVFVGLGQTAELNQQKEPPTAPTDSLTDVVAITQAFLSVQQDANDSCRLRLSGVFTANKPTDVTYRFVDELGWKSQSFVAHIDQTQTVMIDHYYDLPERLPPDGEIDDLTQGDRGGIGGYQTPDADRETGTFQIQVLEPHGYWSNIDGYNVAPCVPSPVFDGGGFQNPTLPPPGGGRPPSTWGKVAG